MTSSESDLECIAVSELILAKVVLLSPSIDISAMVKQKPHDLLVTLFSRCLKCVAV